MRVGSGKVAMDGAEDEPVVEFTGEQERAEVGRILEKLAAADPDGLLQPAAVVEEARAEDSILRRFITWDDDAGAAQQWRLVQARALIRTVNVVRHDVELAPSRHYANVVLRRGTPEARRGYVSVARAVADPDLYLQCLEDARRGVSAYRNRLTAFQRAHELVAVLDSAIGDIDAAVAAHTSQFTERKAS